MKFRKLMLASTFALSVAAAFAFKAKPSGKSAYYEPVVHPSECALGSTDISCTLTGTGPQCTCYDPYSKVFVPAYNAQDNLHGGCMNPLYYPN